MRPPGARIPAGAVIAVAAAALASAIAAGSAAITPTVSPDRIKDVPSAGLGFVFVDNCLRAFIALSWPSELDAAHRGVADRAKALGDPGERVWRRSSPT